ncbi:ABC transporter ATP-binding protein [Virgibacillus salexigens]|uniref:ABC transporter ATP-binding protein n=1 Tax=Virgibacillus massiliensis TaxID=1462526 RepID=UPI003B225F3C
MNNFSLQIKKGEIYGLIGPNGAGKTTLMKMIVGLSSITNGDITIMGKSIRSNKKNALREVGTIIESPDMYPIYTGRQNLIMFARMHHDITSNRVDEVVDIVGLKNSMDKKVKNYSLGMKQRLGIAQALLHKPSVLVLDEPTNGLDPSGIKEMRDYLKDITRRDNVSILISSHLLSEMDLICDRIGVIKQGKLISEHTLDSKVILNEQNLKIIIETDNPKKAEKYLQDYDYIIDNENLLFEIKRDEIPSLIKRLIDNHVLIYRVDYSNPTLEERFFDLIGGNIIA